MVRLYITTFLSKTYQKLGKMSSKWPDSLSKWSISLSFRPPFVKIGRYRPKMHAFDLSDLQFVQSGPLKIDVLSNEKVFDDVWWRYRQEIMYKMYIEVSIKNNLPPNLNNETLDP